MVRLLRGAFQGARDIKGYIVMAQMPRKKADRFNYLKYIRITMINEGIDGTPVMAHNIWSIIYEPQHRNQ
jgi:hypothetical protein